MRDGKGNHSRGFALAIQTPDLMKRKKLVMRRLLLVNSGALAQTAYPARLA
jgi:hypothetical protein